MSSASTSSPLLRIDVELVELENWVRLVSRVLPVGCAALRRHFLAVWKERTAAEWANSPADVSRFSSRFAGPDASVHVLGAETTLHQRSSFACGDVFVWDETLLCRALHVMRASKKGAWHCVREVRNELMHNALRRVSGASFALLFDRFKKAVRQLDPSISDSRFEALRAVPLDADCEAPMRGDGGEARDARAEGDRLAAVDDWAGAIRAYSRGLAFRGVVAAPLTSRLLVRRSMAILRSGGSVDAALVDASEAVRLNTASCDAYCQLAECHRALQAWPALCSALEAARSLTDDSDRRRHITALLDVANDGAQRAQRFEIENLQYTSTLSRGCAAAELASQGVAVATSPNAVPVRDSDMPPQLFRLLPRGQQLLIQAKAASCAGDSEEAFRLFLQAAEGHNEPEAMYNVAVGYSSGKGVSKNLQAAVKWATKAAACTLPERSDMRFRSCSIGVAHAFGMLGNFHNNGVCVVRSGRLAVEYWRRAVATSNLACSAANMLGVAYMDGLYDLAVNIANARDYFRIACDSALRANEALFNMGMVWYRRVHDAHEALPWLKAAQRFGLLSAQLDQAISEVEVAATHAAPESEARLAGLSEQVRRKFEAFSSASSQSAPTLAEPILSPTLAELEAMAPRSHYLELLLSTKRDVTRVVSVATVDPFAGAQLVARIVLAPDFFLVLDPNDVKSLAVVARLTQSTDGVELRLNEQERAAVAFVRDGMPRHPAAVRALLAHHPQSPLLHHILSSLLAFDGPEKNVEAAIHHATIACARAAEHQASLPHADATRLDLLYALGAVRSMDLSNDGFVAVLSTFVDGCRSCSSGHRKLPVAYFKMASAAVRAKRIGEARQLYRLGCEAEQALPPFLQCHLLPLKLMLAALFDEPDEVVRCGGALLRVPGVDSRWLCGDNVLLDHFRAMYAESWSAPPNCVAIGHTQEPAQQSRPLRGVAKRRAIMIDELVSACEDKVFHGRELRVVLVCAPRQRTGLHCIVEDGRRAAIVVALYDAPDELVAQLVVGAVISIRDPYCRICQDQSLQVRVDWPRESVSVESAALTICWACLRADRALKCCGRCARAMYCSEECQRKDWNAFGHKAYCIAKKTD